MGRIRNVKDGFGGEDLVNFPQYGKSAHAGIEQADRGLVHEERLPVGARGAGLAHYDSPDGHEQEFEFHASLEASSRVSYVCGQNDRNAPGSGA